MKIIERGRGCGRGDDDSDVHVLVQYHFSRASLED